MPSELQFYVSNLQRYVCACHAAEAEMSFLVLILITGPDVFQVRDLPVPVSAPAGEITGRVYTPEGPGPFPVHMNMHGGMYS